jgi:hypothetical protein
MNYSSLALAAAALAAALILGCSSTSDGGTVLKDRAKIVEMQNELGTPTFDLTRVVVVRLTVDNERREVTSIMPVVFAETLVPDGPAKTILRVEQKTDTLILFTRDPREKVAYRVEIPVKDRSARPTTEFPVIDATGKVTKRKIVVENIFAR